MDWIDQNLDAYRVIAEILTDLRPLVRERLEAAHGKEWFKDGIPEKVFENLIHHKEKEASIDWYENRYQEVISYAVFPDLFEIILANPGLFDPILKLAPSGSLLNTRFLELEVMRSKIGRGRQVSEAEINFLTSFHLRFRRAIQELRTDDGPVPQIPPVSQRPEIKPEPAPKLETTTEEDLESIAFEESETDDGSEIEKPAAPRSEEGPGRPPMRMAAPASPPKTTAPPKPDPEVKPTVADDGEEASESAEEGSRSRARDPRRHCREGDGGR